MGTSSTEWGAVEGPLVLGIKLRLSHAKHVLLFFDLKYMLGGMGSPKQCSVLQALSAVSWSTGQCFNAKAWGCCAVWAFWCWELAWLCLGDSSPNLVMLGGTMCDVRVWTGIGCMQDLLIFVLSLPSLPKYKYSLPKSCVYIYSSLTLTSLEESGLRFSGLSSSLTDGL